jgi:hypothetical protein
MTLTRSLVIALAAAGGLAATAGSVLADGKCRGPFCNQGAYPRFYTLCGKHNSGLPAFQAAPWYLYWPYDAHFLTPAPVTGAFYGPPTAGNFPVNPYFPGPAYPTGQYPGGPAPLPAAPTAVPAVPTPVPGVPTPGPNR